MSCEESESSKKDLDLLFILDTTESREKYISATKQRCKEVCFTLQHSGQIRNLRLGILAFRDHDDSYVTDNFGGFTSDVDQAVNDLDTLKAEGGGDCPEAVTAALQGALDMFEDDPDTVKIAVLITDAPPHGIGERDDDYPGGDKNGRDPLLIVREMHRRGISLLIIACEPILSNGFERAHDFYQALAKITAGLMLPLTDENLLAPLVIGFALEHVRLDSLISEFRSFVLTEHKKGTPDVEITRKLQDILDSRNQMITTPVLNIKYKEPPTAEKAVSIWTDAKTTAEARKALQGIPALKRLPREFLLPNGATWSRHPVQITLKNMRDHYIQYCYTENGELVTGMLEPAQIDPTPKKLNVNEPYNFTLRVGRRVVSTSRTFTMDSDFDMSAYFD